MSAIILTKPETGKIAYTKHVAGTTYKINFPVADVRVLRADDGVSLEFPDAAKIVLAGYTPEGGEAAFEADGKMLDAEKFLSTLDENLPEPAMGPEKPQTPPKPADDGGHYNEYDVSALLTGIDHLWGLDIGFDSAVPEDRIRLADPAPYSGQTEYGWIYSAIPVPNEPAAPEAPEIPVTRPEPPVAADPVVPQPAPVGPEPVRPEPEPVIPEPEPKPEDPEPEPKPIVPEPDKPIRPEPSDPVPPIIPDPIDPVVPGPEPVIPDPVVPEPTKPEASNIPVREDGIENGDSVPVTIPGYEIVEVVENGGKGTLEKDPETGEWKYTLKESSDHPDPGQDVLPDGDKVVIKVRDPEGNEYEIEQKFDIVDDTPETSDDHQKTVSGDPAGVGGQIVIDFGADDDPEKTDVKISINGKDYKPGDEIRGDHGVLIITPDGKYEYRADPKGLDDPDTGTDEFSVTVKDADGDEAEGKITIDIVKPAGPDPDTVLIDESLLPNGNAKAGVEVPGYTILDIITNGSQGSLSREGNSWIYTLSEKQDHSAQGKDVKEGVDTVTLLVRDANGNEYAVERIINVIDDIPEAAINGGGTVMSGDPAGISGTIDIDWGVDDNASKKLFVSFGGKEKLLDFRHAERYGINSEHGLLVIEKDGTWTYEAKPLAAGQDSARDGFSIKVVDSDGDIASPKTWAEAWLKDNPDKTPDDMPPSPYETTIDIVKPDGPANPENVTVSEKGLPETNPDVPVTPPDGYEIVDVKTPGENGTLEKDPETGEWKYVLATPEDHPDPGEDRAKDGDTVVIVVKDKDGNEYEIEQKVDIIDDTPEAGNDHKEVISGDPEGVSGSITIDYGADNDPDKTEVKIEGKKPGGEIRGNHGVIVVNKDGSYTYKADPKGVDDPDTSTDEFKITVKDADGDEVEGKIVIDVKKPEGPDPDSVLVDEALLPDGGAKNVVEVPGYTILEVVTNGANGLLAQDGASWIYTLGQKQEHSAQGKDVKEGVDTVVLKVKDANGNEYLVERTINVIDDVPEASISGDASVLAGNEISGAITIDWGVDNDASRKLFVTINGEETEIAGKTEIEGAHGKLTVDANGEWTYTANGLDKDSISVKENISVRVVDSDGDIASPQTWAEAWLRDNPDKTPDDVPPSPYETVIDISKPDGPRPAEVSVNEKGLRNDGHPEVVVDIEGYEIVEILKNGDKGTLDKDGKYILNDNADHLPPNGEELPEGDTVRLVVRDSKGNEYIIDQPIKIIDDAPEAKIDEAEKSTLSGDPDGVSGKVDIEFGADNDEGKKFVVKVNGKDEEFLPGTEIRGDHGVLTIDQNGNYAYVSDPKGIDDPDGKDVFSFEVTDSDGDTASAELTVNVAKPVVSLDPINSHEKNMASGDAINSGGYTILDVLGQGQFGQVEKSGDQWIYKLNDNLDHGQPGSETDEVLKNKDSVILKVQDKNGNVYSVDVPVNVHDDTPDASLDKDSASIVAGKEFSGKLDYNFGADNDSAKKIVVEIGDNEAELSADSDTVISGQYGVLTVRPDGSYKYKANEGQEGKEDFSFKVTDSDGDTVGVGADGSSTLKVTVDVKDQPPVNPIRPVLEDGHLIVNEKDMASDSAKAGITITDKDGKTYTILEVVEDGFFGKVVQEDGNWVYRLDKAAAHDGDGRDTMVNADMVRLKVSDEDGNVYIVNRKVDIIDDIPDMNLSERDLGNVIAGAESSVNGKLDYNFGADDREGAELVVTVDGKEIKLEAGKENVVQGKYGELVIAEDGSYTYRANADGQGKDKFTFRIEDADGDVVESDASGKTFDVVVDVHEAKEPENGEITVNERDMRGGGLASAELTVDGFEIIGVIGEAAKGVVEQVDGKWIYTLDGVVKHGQQGADTARGVDSVVLKVKDAAGNEYEVTKTVNVIDDVPEMSVSGGGSIKAGETVEGTIGFEFGADGRGSVEVNGQEFSVEAGTVINGKYGDLTINGDGTWTYKANEDNQYGRDNFQFKITDADGDISDSEAGAGVLIGEKKPYEIDINVLPAGVEVEPDIIYEQELALGAINLDVSIDGWTIVSATPQGHAGKMVKDADGEWKYVLDHALAHENSVNIVDTVRLELIDANGNKVSVDKRIDIVDDKPRLSIEDADIPLMSGIAVNERDLRDGGRAVTGLDGEGYEILGVLDQGSIGKVFQDENGAWFYELNGAIKSSSVQGANIDKGVDYIYLAVKDENGFVRKVEVPVDVVDDAPSRSIYENMYCPQGETVDFFYSKEFLDEIAGADGYRGNGDYKLSLGWKLAYNEFIYEREYGTIGNDNDSDFINSSILLHRIDYDVTPEVIIGSDGYDFINPNPKFNYVPGETTSQYWTPSSQENVIYGCGGNDIILGEGHFTAPDADVEYINMVFYDYANGSKYYNEVIEKQTPFLDIISDIKDKLILGEITYEEYNQSLNDFIDRYPEIFYEYQLSRNEINKYNSVKNILSQNNATYYPDLIYGGSGDDKIYMTGAGGVTFGDGTDDINIDIYGRLLELTGLDCKFYDLASTIYKLSFAELEKIASQIEIFDNVNDGNDYIEGSVNNVCFGNGGNDKIYNFLIGFGGSGHDSITGHSLYSYGFGGSGNDYIHSCQYAFGGIEDDMIMNCTYAYGGSGNDYFTYCSFVDGGDGIDIIGVNNSIEYFNNNLSEGIKYGNIKNTEIMFYDVNLRSVFSDGGIVRSFYQDENGAWTTDVHDFLYSPSEHQIIVDEEAQTLTLGPGWKKYSEAGMGDYKTTSYLYTDEQGYQYIIETTLDVPGMEDAPMLNSFKSSHSILSGHESAVAGQLIHSFGADDGSGKKLSVFVDGNEFILNAKAANTVQGKYGILTIDENGLFSYKANPNANGKDEFFFRIEDSDGTVVDTDIDGNPISLTVNVEKPVLEIGNESIMEGPQNINLNLTGYELVDVRMDSEVASISHSGSNWNYVLDGAIDHETYGDTPGGNHTDTLYLTYRDRFGNIYDVEKQIIIQDEAPELWNMDVNLINKFETTESSRNSDLEWFYDFGADTWGDKASIAFLGADGQVNIKEGTEQRIRGEFGWMTLVFSNGHVDFHYEADEEAEVRDTFNFQFTDSDGDTRENHIEIRTRFGIDIDEGNMGAAGSNNLVKLPAWLSDCRIIDIEIQNTAGYAYQDETGDWYYYLDNPLDHVDDAPGVLGENNDIIQDEIILWYRDQDGRLSNVVNSVFIHDSNPDLVDYTVNAENMTTIIGGTDAKDNPYFYDFGADDNPEKAKLYITGADGKEREVELVSPMEIRGEHGTFSINASDGHLAYMYEMHEDKKGTSCTDVFNFRIVDSDGDEKTSTFTVNTIFDENYDPNRVYDPADIQPAQDEVVPDNIKLGTLDEDNSAEDAKAMGGNQESKKEDGALPSDVVPETDATATIPDNQDMTDADNLDEAQTGDGESSEQNAEDSSNEPDTAIKEDTPNCETSEIESPEKTTGGMDPSGCKPGEEEDSEAVSGGNQKEDSEENIRESTAKLGDQDFPEDAGRDSDNAPGDADVSVEDDLDKLFAENGFKVAKAEPKAPEIRDDDLPEVSLVDGKGNIDIDALMASVREDSREDADKGKSSSSTDKDESRSSLSVIEPAEPEDNENYLSNDRDDDFNSSAIEIPNDIPDFDVSSEAEVAAQVMAEAGFA